MNLAPDLRSASFQIWNRSLPENVFVISESCSSSSSLSCLAYFLRISNLVSLSGRSNLMEISILDTRAESRSSFLFVAQIRSTFPRVSKESIFLRSVESTLLVASWIPPSLDAASESISSINKIQSEYS